MKPAVITVLAAVFLFGCLSGCTVVDRSVKRSSVIKFAWADTDRPPGWRVPADDVNSWRKLLTSDTRKLDTNLAAHLHSEEWRRKAKSDDWLIDWANPYQLLYKWEDNYKKWRKDKDKEADQDSDSDSGGDEDEDE